MSNPYTLVFGQPPIEFIERTAQAERILFEFCQERPSNRINLVTGVRGCGKTVFITDIANRLREKEDWVVINLNPKRDLLVGLAAKLDSNSLLHHLFRKAEINLSAFGIGVGMRGVPAISDIEEALIRMLQSLKKSGKRVLVTIDEVTNSQELRAFTSAFQIFLREDLPVFLLMTGLYKHIDSLRNADGMTFLERAPRTVLSPLDLNAVREKYQETLGLKEDAAIRLARATKGYPFAFQTVGYFQWENPDNEEKALSDAKEYLYEFAYWKIWSELSKKDRAVVSAIAKTPSGSVLEIRKKLNYTNSQFNPYRSRLLKAGIIRSPENGELSFCLPWFDAFAEYARMADAE